MVKFKSGMQAKIVGNSGNHSLPDGEIVTLTQRMANGMWMTDRGVYVNLRDIKAIELTEREIQEEIAKLKAEVDVLEARVRWMKETNTAQYDETEFKVWMTLKAMDKKMSPIERARMIARIIKGE
jgi:hypothetical protein